MNAVVTFIFDFQTLVTGIAAVAIGGASIWYLRNQISETRKQFSEELKESKRQFDAQMAASDRQREDELSRKLRAARAALPNSLAEITDYAEQCCREIYRCLEIFRRNERASIDLNLPVFPYQSFNAFVPIIESALEADARALADFISYGQVQRSRLEGLANRLGHNPRRPTLMIASSSFTSSIRDALGLYAFADRVYAYARGREQSIADFYSGEEASHKLQMNINITDPEVYRAVVRPWPPRV